jgi:hypothetical protein
MSDFGCLLLPLSWYIYPIEIVFASIALYLGGMYISYYYHIRNVHVNEYAFKFGQPIFVLAWVFILWRLSLPLITVPFGIVLFFFLIVAIQLFRKYVLGIHDVCSIENAKK